MKTLQVIEQAFRTLVEEQDDTILWITQAMLGAGADVEILLSGNCSYYAILRRRQPPLTLGKWQQAEPAEITRDLDVLYAKGIPMYVVHEELAERGLLSLPVHAGVKVIDRDQLAGLYGRVDQVWQW